MEACRLILFTWYDILVFSYKSEHNVIVNTFDVFFTLYLYMCIYVFVQKAIQMSIFIQYFTACT